MIRKILLTLITILTLLANCLEGRYHLDATELRHHRHHRHDRHHQVWNHEEIARGSRRRDWENDENLDLGEDALMMDHHYKERPSVFQSRRSSSGLHDRRSSLGSFHHRGRYDSQRRGRGRHQGRDYRHPSVGSTPWRHTFQEGVKGRIREGNNRGYASSSSSSSSASSSSSGRSDRSWPYGNPSRYNAGRHREEDYQDFVKPSSERKRPPYDDEEDDGYEADDEEYYPPRKTGNSYPFYSKGRRNRLEYEKKRKEEADEYNDDDYEDPDYEDYDVDERTKPPPRRRQHNKRTNNNFADFVGGKKTDFAGHQSQNDVGGRRVTSRRKDRFLEERKQKERESPEDLNEVEEIDEVEDDVWDDSEDEDYDDDFEFSRENVKSSSKIIDDVIRKLSASDITNTTTTSKLAAPRRDSRNIENDRNFPKDNLANSYESTSVARFHSQRVPNKKFQNNWGLTTTSTSTTSTTSTTTTTTSTAKPPFYRKFTNSSRNEIGTVLNKKIPKVYSASSSVDIKKPPLTQIAKPDPESKTKTSEQDYEEYENDGIDERAEDAEDVDGENENDKKYPSEKDQDYNEEDNPEGNDDATETVPSIISSTTLFSLPSFATTASTTTTTTTTTTTPTPIISTRSFDRGPKIFDQTRSRQSNFRNSTPNFSRDPPMSSYSAQKWNILSSRKAIDKYLTNGKGLHSTDVQTVLDHIRKMDKEAICRLPKPKIITVRDIYPSASKKYEPSCTILHRCADDTGCCKLGTSCEPKNSKIVELSFYASGIEISRHVEKLKFVNHTECECRTKTRPEPPTPPPKPCKCTSRFVPVTTSDGTCRCDCLSNSESLCLRQKRGKEPFNDEDRWCIQRDQCTLPSCEWGPYKRREARCTNLEERVNAARKQNASTVRYKK